MIVDLLGALNPPQREAVTHGQGPLLVLAGAGSGKTRVLTHRLAYLVAERLATPAEITAVTFTNKAAREMRERVRTLVGGDLEGAFVGTFHRWALDMLRAHPAAAGLPPRFAILDSDDQRALMLKALKDLGLDPKVLPPRALLSAVSRRRNLASAPREAEDEPAARLAKRYAELKHEAGAVDFDDMLVLALAVLRREQTIREAVRRRCRFLLVDEFQDSNQLQMQLLEQALGEERNLTAVGDEDQSIYRWRGAEVDNILSFERHFPNSRVVKLEENYRSTQPILAAAGELIARNLGRRGKTLFTRSEGGEPVRLFVGRDEQEEARWVVERLEEMSIATSLGEMAVLVRTNAQTRPFEEQLTRRRVAYRVVGGLRFWQRAEVKDALAYLRLVVNAADVVAFRRVVNVPARGIGAATMDILEREATAVGSPLPLVARRLPDSLGARARSALERFFALLDEAAAKAVELRPEDFVGWLLEASGLLSLYQGDDEEKLVRRENLSQLQAAVAEGAAQGQSLEAFLEAIALLEEGDEATASEAVNLMTLHAAKGLEFDIVILAGLEDGLLPHASAREQPEELEEERRLAYVGMTRARKWLALTAVRSRFLHGQRQSAVPSLFLRELPSSLYRDVSDEPWWSTAGFGQERERSTPPRFAAPQRPAAVASSPRARRPLPTVQDGDGTSWRAGERVKHPRFGPGIVLSCQGRGAQLKLVIFFDRAGRKTLVPSYARLEKL